MNDTPVLHSTLQTLLKKSPPRAGPLAVTLFGDCISQQGGCVWLGSLVRAMTQFGLNSQQIRTAVFRLTQDGWFSAEQRGRRSYYRFSEFGQRQFARAATRIYAVEQAPWDGQWTLLLEGEIAAEQRDELRRRLGWLGFGQLAKNLMAHPSVDVQMVTAVLTELELTEQCVVWQARADNDLGLKPMVNQAWQLPQLAGAFSALVSSFRVFSNDFTQLDFSDRDNFILRSLMVHEYRRVLLKTHDLPLELLPVNWPGHAATELFRDIYRLTQVAACRHASDTLEDEHGALPAPMSEFYTRLGGLQPPTAAYATAPA